jgi:DNA recombination protein RmuC
MDGMTVALVGLVALAAGVVVGFALRRGAVERAEAEAAAARAAVAEAQVRVVALTAEAARARGEAAQLGDLKAALQALERRHEALQAERAGLAAAQAALTAELEAERRATAERRAEAEASREQVRAEVEKLAGRLLEAQGKALLERSREGLQALLGPVAERLKDFERKVETTHLADTQERAALKEHLRALQEAQARLHHDAEALSRALLRDQKQQGDWGEIVLERVLEGAGLAKGREFDLQVSHADEAGGQKRPDALVYLPEDRAVVVDAKCSLTAFVAAGRAEDEAARQAALDAHLASVRAHAKGLAGKRYTEVLRHRTLDFVMLFVPSEAAFFAALTRDPGLYEEAFRQGVVLTSPTTLMAALRLIAQLWRSERQDQNARRIAEEAGRLLDKLQGFVADLDGVGDRLRQAQDTFDAARGKLATGKGNLLRRAALVMRLGAPVRSEKVRALLAPHAEGEGAEDGSEPAGPAAEAPEREGAPGRAAGPHGALDPTRTEGA